MDIIDIMLAKAMTPQGKTETYVSIANAAAAKAAKAKTDAEDAIATVNAAAEDISTAQESAAQLLADAQEALETAQSAQINTLDTEDVDDEIKKLSHSITISNSNDAKTVQLTTTYPDNTNDTDNVIKMYKGTGNNEDGTMTQKAITQAIGNSGGGGGNVTGNFSTDDAGYIVIVGENGNIETGVTSEEDLIEALIRSGAYSIRNAVGLDIDYSKRIFTRTQEAVGKSMGIDFNSYIMYGGRTRCNVNDNGEITAFYGDNNYTEDGSNGQVMVYQPKFYYKRIIYDADDANTGKIVRHEGLILSPTKQIGFKLAPVFGNDLDYVLLPAFDAGLVNSKLTSIAGVKPITNISIANAEDYANARGQGWHIMTMAAESANQMLEMVEFGTMNGQNAIESGITYDPSEGKSCYFITGSTGILGNTTGHANTTQVEINGNIQNYSTEGYRAISYRGMENPWGNLWCMVGGVNINGNGSQNGGVPYICTNFNYTPGIIGSNYESAGFSLPNKGSWVNAMGYGDEKYDWIYMPAEVDNGANSLLPVGDSMWIISNLNNTVITATGGFFGLKEACGPFYYASDHQANDTSRYNYGAKLLFIPTKNAIYTANIAKWNTYMGG